jgi:hypothetical protein
VDVALVEYDVELITEGGVIYDLDNALISLAWEEQEGQLAQKAVVTVVNIKTGSGYLMSLAKLNCMIRPLGRGAAEDVRGKHLGVELYQCPDQGTHPDRL